MKASSSLLSMVWLLPILVAGCQQNAVKKSSNTSGSDAKIGGGNNTGGKGTNNTGGNNTGGSTKSDGGNYSSSGGVQLSAGNHAVNRSNQKMDKKTSKSINRNPSDSQSARTNKQLQEKIVTPVQDPGHNSEPLINNESDVRSILKATQKNNFEKQLQLNNNSDTPVPIARTNSGSRASMAAKKRSG